MIDAANEPANPSAPAAEAPAPALPAPGPECFLDRELNWLQFNLRVLMSEGPRSAYVSGASLRIVGPDGRDRLKADDVGPYVDVKLPAGRYTMTAVFEGRTREAAVQVRAEGLARVHLHWADERADRDGGSRP